MQTCPALVQVDQTAKTAVPRRSIVPSPIHRWPIVPRTVRNKLTTHVNAWVLIVSRGASAFVVVVALYAVHSERHFFRARAAGAGRVPLEPYPRLCVRRSISYAGRTSNRTLQIRAYVRIGTWAALMRSPEKRRGRCYGRQWAWVTRTLAWPGVGVAGQNYNYRFDRGVYIMICFVLWCSLFVFRTDELCHRVGDTSKERSCFA